MENNNKIYRVRVLYYKECNWTSGDITLSEKYFVLKYNAEREIERLTKVFGSGEYEVYNHEIFGTKIFEGELISTEREIILSIENPQLDAEYLHVMLKPEEIELEDSVRLFTVTREQKHISNFEIEEYEDVDEEGER